MTRSITLISALLLAAPGLTLAQTDPESSAAAAPSADIVITEQEEVQVLSTELIGKEVLHPQGDKIGTLDSLLFDADQKIVGGVVSVGGFLGIGAKSVALSWDAFSVHQEEDAVLLDLTKEQLEQAPGFKSLAQIEAEREIERQQELIQQQQMNSPQQPVPSPE